MQASSADVVGGMPQTYIMQMQKAVGNKAVMQMLGEERAAPTGRARSNAIYGRPGEAVQGRPGNMRPPIAPVAAAPAAPSPPIAVQIPGNLQGKGQYHAIYSWLQGEAQKSKKESLFGFFDALSPQQKMAAIDIMAGSKSPELGSIQSKMVTGLISKSLNWDRFSVAAREAKSINTTNYNADTSGDYAGYTLTGSGVAASGVAGSAKQSDLLFGAAGAKPVAEGAAPVAAGLGGLAALAQVYGAASRYDSATQSVAENQQAVADGAAGLSDAARSGADTANTIRTAAGMAVSGAATAVAGAGAIVGGAAYMVGGVRGYRDANRNLQELSSVKERLQDKEPSDMNEKLGLAADLGSSTQEMRKTTSAATAAKGALMVAGGIALLVAAASPLGPILLAAAAALGGIAAVVKFYRKHKRKESFVDKVMNVDEEMKKPENEGLGKDKVRQKVIESKGFNGTSQCYAQIVTDLSMALYEGGVRGGDEESVSIIESIGLKVDSVKQTPSQEAIAKKLNG